MEHIQPLRARNGQPLPAFCAASLQDEPAVFRTHPDEKTVHPFPSARVWLKRAFTFHGVLLIENEPLMLANAFRECQLNAGYVTVGVLSRFVVRSGSGRCCSGSHQSFPHLWKKLWKIAVFTRPTGRERRISRHNRAERLKTWEKRQNAQPSIFVPDDRFWVSARHTGSWVAEGLTGPTTEVGKPVVGWSRAPRPTRATPEFHRGLLMPSVK
jgi:hypothetical protein